MTDVIVVGAGIAGLACASEASVRGLDVQVFEADASVGGCVESARVGDLLLERGASTVRANEALYALAERAGIALVDGRRRAPAVVSGGVLVPLPPGPADLLRGRPFPLPALLGALLEPLRSDPGGPRTVQQFFDQRFGPGLGACAADLMTLGVYGAPAARIGFESAFPGLADRLERHGSLARGWLATRGGSGARAPLVSTAAGLGALCTGLAESLGERVHTSAPVTAVARNGAGFDVTVDGRTLRARDVVLAVGPDRAARLIDTPPLHRVLGTYRASPQTLATFALADADCVERTTSFGFLVPLRERLPLLGCLFPTAIFADRAPADTLLLTVFVGPELVDAPDGELHRALAPILARLLGCPALPELVDVRRHRPGIWLYDRRHRDRTRVLRGRLERSDAPHLIGYAFDGVAFGAAATAGIAKARELTLRA